MKYLTLKHFDELVISVWDQVAATLNCSLIKYRNMITVSWCNLTRDGGTISNAFQNENCGCSCGFLFYLFIFVNLLCYP